MLTLHTANYAWPLVSTKFPDGTSQVWKLPEGILQSKDITIDWRFEEEREIIDLLSLRKLLPTQELHLMVSFLPYARQDKEVSNTSTFNLEVLADVLNSMKFMNVISFDTHNPRKTFEMVRHFSNIEPKHFHFDTLQASNPDYIVFPDAGAESRYAALFKGYNIPVIVCDKDRDQLTGAIVGHKILTAEVNDRADRIRAKFLVVDDLCDGGATFISVAKLLKEQYVDADVELCVSHGVFSRGKEHLLNNGISKIYTTNSLSKNGDGFSV